MSEIQEKLDYADAIADWFLEIGEAHCRGGNLEAGLKCTQIAATILCRQSRNLSSARVEANLHFAAERLAEYSGPNLVAPRKQDQKAVCLHVLDEALPAGGLTAMAMRWMRSDRSGRIHSVALLSQQVPVPEALIQTVRETGGNIYRADASDSFVRRAIWLRKLARDSVGCVILHIGVTDVICGVAFGTKGGPPVLLVNHAAHIFWTGASIPDLVVNCRGSALEVLWTTTHRDSRCTTVPIPLPEPDSRTVESELDPDQKREAKIAIGVPADSIAILTVGAAFKYSPVGDLDFLKVVESVLDQIPDAFLLVVGFHADSRWRQAAERSGSRVKTFGVVSQAQLARIQAAADLYVEGFPFGSTTALLEAGLKGVPVVLPPAPCPPPYTSDGVALDEVLERPATIEDFKSEIIRLSRSLAARSSSGDQIRRAIRQHHTGVGWRQYLESTFETLPLEHSVRSRIAPIRTPEAAHEYWYAFVSTTDSGYEETLEHAVTRALLMDLRPRLTRAAIEACRRHRAVRRQRTIPLPLLIVLCNYLLPVLPIACAQKLFRLVSFLCRKSLLARVRTWAVALFEGTKRKRSWYEEYRNARG